VREHGEKIVVDFGVKLPVNVCKNPECRKEVVILFVRENGDVWEQIGNKFGGLYCPYCTRELGRKEEKGNE
jgi:hypothetical protein